LAKISRAEVPFGQRFADTSCIRDFIAAANVASTTNSGNPFVELDRRPQQHWGSSGKSLRDGRN
jgi:hypothetical protein